jgi:hypothetical protein
MKTFFSYRALGHKMVLKSAVCAAAAGIAAFAHAGATKDVVLERIHQAQTASVAVVSDAMAVSVLQEHADGTLRSRGVDAQMRTGDRLRIKLIATREGRVSIYNTTPRGETKPEPIWSGAVRPGQETVSPRLVLTNQSGAGVEQLHVVLEPQQAPGGVFVWVGQWLTSVGKGVQSTSSKDVVLDVENTPTATYLVNTRGQGLVTTVSVAHR